MDVIVSGLKKSFGNNYVLRDVNFAFKEGETYCIMGASGMGKTTLLRVMLGLEAADEGSVVGMTKGRVSAMFQEDRLVNVLTPIENVALVCNNDVLRSDVKRLLCEILPPACMKMPVLALSGGMRRRVSLVRAIAYPSDVIVLDEPFTGLDTLTRQRVISFIKEHQNGRTLIVSTHGEQDALLLQGQRVLLSEISNDAIAGEEELQEKKEEIVMSIDSTKTMREIVTNEPEFGEFLVSKGFPFTLENPMTELVTFDDVCDMRKLDKEAFLAEYAQFVIAKK